MAKRRSESVRERDQRERGAWPHERAEAEAAANGAAVADLEREPEAPEPQQQTTPQQEPAKECVGALCGSLDMPLGPPSNYAADHIEMRLRPLEASALDRLWTGCQRENVFLTDGRRVNSRADVVRLMLERFAAYLEA